MIIPNVASTFVVIELRRKLGTDQNPIGTHEFKDFWDSLSTEEKRHYIEEVTQNHLIVRTVALQDML